MQEQKQENAKAARKMFMKWTSEVDFTNFFSRTKLFF